MRLKSPGSSGGLQCSDVDVQSLRTTNSLENLNREFRRRTKTQASFGTEAAAITVLYGLVAFGQIMLRRIDGHEQLPAFLAKGWCQAA
jgi:putative transposase